MILRIRLFRAAFGLATLQYIISVSSERRVLVGFRSLAEPFCRAIALESSFASQILCSAAWMAAILTVSAALCIRPCAKSCTCWEIATLFFLQALLSHANPVLLREPQPIGQILLASLLLISDKDSEEIQTEWCEILLAFLGIYYGISGVKEISDPHWLQGGALKLLFNWGPLTQSNGLGVWLGKQLPASLLSILT